MYINNENIMESTVDITLLERWLHPKLLLSRSSHVIKCQEICGLIHANEAKWNMTACVQNFIVPVV
jgi:hypothetical protein